MKQKELHLHTAHSQAVKLLASGGCCFSKITWSQKGIHTWWLNAKTTILRLKKISQLQNPWGLVKHSRDLLIACHVLAFVPKYQPLRTVECRVLEFDRTFSITTHSCSYIFTVPEVGEDIPCLATSQAFVQDLLTPNTHVMLNIFIITWSL